MAGYPLDAGDRDQIDALVDAVTASLGPVQILVNNAAVNVVGSIFGYDPADWDRVVRVNLTGPWYLCRRAMPLMRDAGGGVIVNVGSYAPDVGGGGIEAPYAASKGGLSALTRGLAHEGGPHPRRLPVHGRGQGHQVRAGQCRVADPDAGYSRRSVTCRARPTSPRRWPSSPRIGPPTSPARCSTWPAAPTCATDHPAPDHLGAGQAGLQGRGDSEQVPGPARAIPASFMRSPHALHPGVTRASSAAMAGSRLAGRGLAAALAVTTASAAGAQTRGHPERFMVVADGPAASRRTRKRHGRR